MTAPLVFLDTETTGLHPGREAWEVAMIRREPDFGSTERVVQFFVDTRSIDLAYADPMALKIGKFYDRHPHYTRPVGQEIKPYVPKDYHPGNLVVLNAENAAKAVWRFTRGAHVVGAVPNFDTETLDALLREHNHLPGWHYHLIDVENLAVGYISALLTQIKGDLLGWDRGIVRAATQPPWSSRDLGKILGVEQDESTLHTALGDAQWAMAMYDRIMS